MGIENSVRRKYGDAYWEANKEAILRRANKHGALDAQGIRKMSAETSRQRRARRRAFIRQMYGFRRLFG